MSPDEQARYADAQPAPSSLPHSVMLAGLILMFAIAITLALVGFSSPSWLGFS